LGILRVCLVPHLIHLHCAFGRHGPCRNIQESLSELHVAGYDHTGVP
jgi:hypothetical protein